MTRKNLALIALMIALCGTLSAEAGSATASPRALQSLNLVVGATGVPYGPIWVALANNLFEKNGLDVNVLSFAGIQTGSAQLVAGQADLFASSTAVGVQLQAQGQPAKAVYALSYFTAYMFDWMAKTGITSMAQLQNMGTSCKIGEGLAGTGGFAYTQEFMKANNLHCSLVNVANPTAAAQAVESGQVDAAAVFPQDATAAVAANLGVVLVDATKLTPKDALKLVPDPFLAVGIVGLDNDLKAKKDSVVAFIRALREAQVMMFHSSPSALANWTLQVPGHPFGTTTADALTASWQVTLPTFPPLGANAGAITQPLWNTALAGFQNEFKTPGLDASSTAAQYGNAVDMSYFNAATIALAANGTPAIKGTAKVGRTLVAKAPKWTGKPAAVDYQWQACAAKCTDIKGARAATLKLTASVRGQKVRAIVTGVSPTGNTARTISAKLAVS